MMYDTPNRRSVRRAKQDLRETYAEMDAAQERGQLAAARRLSRTARKRTRFIEAMETVIREASA